MYIVIFMKQSCASKWLILSWNFTTHYIVLVDILKYKLNQIVKANLQPTANVASGNSRLHQASDWSHDNQKTSSCNTHWMRRSPVFLADYHVTNQRPDEVWNFPDATLPVSCKYFHYLIQFWYYSSNKWYCWKFNILW